MTNIIGQEVKRQNKRIYHIGTSKQGKTLVIEAVRNKDFLSCEIYDYFGRRITTKQELRDKRYEFLGYLQVKRPEVYKGLKYAIVS